MQDHYEKQKEEKKKEDLLARLAQQMNDHDYKIVHHQVKLFTVIGDIKLLIK